METHGDRQSTEIVERRQLYPQKSSAIASRLCLTNLYISYKGTLGV